MTTEEKIRSLAKLEENWDGYGAAPVRPELIEVAINLLSILNIEKMSVVPTRIGGVQFEWHYNGIDAELEVIDVDNIEFFFEKK